MAQLQAVYNWLIYFDDVRIEDIVKTWSVNISSNGSIGTANIELLYFQELAFDANNSMLSSINSDMKNMLGVIDNMTNVKIFMQNVFSDKYQLIFDGNIKSKNVVKSPTGNSLSLQAVDYINYMNKTIAPICLPVTLDTHPSDKFILEAQGIDTSKVLTLQTRDMINFKGKSIKQILSLICTQALAANKIFSDRAGVSYWDGIWDRMDLMADIDKKILESEVSDYIIDANASNINTMYVLLNQVLEKLLFEIYQDRDGVIRIKPPYWNQPVLKSHIIDPILISNMTENYDYQEQLSRVIITGGLDEDYQTNNDYAKYLWTPIGCYMSNGTWMNAKEVEGYEYGWAPAAIVTSSTDPGNGDDDTTSPPGDDVPGGNSTCEKVWNFFKGKNFSDAACAGICGCIETESGWDPTLVNSIGASGLCQWLGSRFTALKNFASSKGTSWKDVDTQIQFLWKELEEGKVTTWSLAKTTYSAYKQVTDVPLAVAQFQWAFERAEKGPNSYPGIYGDKIGWYMKKRIAAGEKIYRTYANKGSTSSVSVLSVYKPASVSYINKNTDGSPVVGYGSTEKIKSYSGCGVWFPTVESGIKAHIQQLSYIYRHGLYVEENYVNPYYNIDETSCKKVSQMSTLKYRNKFYGDKLISLLNDMNSIGNNYALHSDYEIGTDNKESYDENVSDFYIQNLKNFFMSRMVGKNFMISDNSSIANFFNLYVNECKKQLIYPDVALAQMIIDTGWLCWGGCQSYLQNNFYRIGDFRNNTPSKAEDWYWEK